MSPDHIELPGDIVLIKESLERRNVEAYLRGNGLFNVVNSPGVYDVVTVGEARSYLGNRLNYTLRRPDGSPISDPDWDEVEMVAYTTEVFG